MKNSQNPYPVLFGLNQPHFLPHIYTLCCLKSNNSCVSQNGASISKTFSEQIRWLNGKVLDWYTLFFLFQISFFTINLMGKIVVRCKIKEISGHFFFNKCQGKWKIAVLRYCHLSWKRNFVLDAILHFGLKFQAFLKHLELSRKDFRNISDVGTTIFF